jgi:uncharacterized membrane protein
MSNGYVVVIGAFEDEKTAQKAYQTLEKRLKKEKDQKTMTTEITADPELILQDVAIIHRTEKGKVKMSESAEMSGKKGAAIGGAVGALLGIVSGPVGWVTLGGAVVGGLLAKRADHGLPNTTLEHLGKGLETGKAAVVAVVAEVWGDRFSDVFKELGAVVTTEGLDAGTVERLKNSA